ncbi:MULTISPECIES: LrgB family protein [unclassified Campylobacter]|uniref:LrgB family protein n=1 Tax=unclassified Campylobacter TaxID=2593542 RepID=UPI0022E99B88|nr:MULTISPECIES: LrgB family protein [unclassified Campylobacter]MDA3047156.1 LrgB family protein [Campylobacter sp. JMF_08 NE1]MDA3053835.1 LrgB family protein [Campylobacter sp. VBCF_07 NA4]MDA3060276.1 LrgB family protein [Campylobacter sp. VBCF_02 NA5]MDA3069792.1 LrgB family protein [Campylobacter sp. VBCF_08 NA3]MDA3078432.1 LrgB family protein [Campylobacter sp. JMF_06 NA1]
MREILINSAFFGVFLCLISFQAGIYLKKRFKLAIFNPLLVGTILTVLTLVLVDIPYDKFNASAAHVSFFLTPITVCLAVPLYEQLSLLRKNFVAIFAGLFSGVLAGTCSIYALALIFGIDHALYVTLLPKSVTAPIGMGISESLGGIVNLTMACIIATGILGNIFGEAILRLFRIKKSVAKGIALGCASHAMGTAKALEIGDIEGAMASLAMAVTGLFTVVGASIFANFI